MRTSRRPRNRKRRNWNPLIRRCCVVALALEAAVALGANPYLRVTRVRVEGVQTLSAAQVFAEAQVPARTNMLWMALRERFDRRLAVDPVIDHVSRSFALPDTLVLHVAERQPYAVLAAGGSYWLLDRAGVPFRAVEAPPPGVPQVQWTGDLPNGTLILGKPLRADWLHQAYQLLALLATTKNLTAAKIKVDQNANLCLNSKENLVIKLGQPDALPEKIALAQDALASNSGEIARQAAYIDVSCPQQMVWKPRSAVGSR